MRHNNATNPLGRKSAHRKAMLSNMASSLILHKRIKTTTAKAKALRVFVEPILTKSKEDSTHARRSAFASLKDKKAVHELFKEVSPKIIDRPGGYTRILKIGNREGDAAEICFIELVDFNTAMLGAKESAEARTTRRSRRGSTRKKKTETVVEGAEKTRGSKAKPAEEKSAVVQPESPDQSEPENKA
ncbi:MAG: 50S ribosomal protein L17 [Bacteroidales bacterium]|nr:50S ribosomal protein L17 [Bacteroidales bacterium]MBN2763134.1 50S ribosomal protein L17 [Bacteroidales bacterium]